MLTPKEEKEWLESHVRYILSELMGYKNPIVQVKFKGEKEAKDENLQV